MVKTYQILSCEKHPNADTLWVYQVSCPDQDTLTVLSNQEVAVGSIMAVATVGTILKDGTRIEKRKIRGVLSFGMFMGSADEVGLDQTALYGATAAPEAEEETNPEGVVEDSAWPRYTSLESFFRVKDEILSCPMIRVTEKVHGHNVRFGYTRTRKWCVGTHTARVIASRMGSDKWPVGHALQKQFLWLERMKVEERVQAWKEAHPKVWSLAVYGEGYGWKCSDLHYGLKDESRVILFGEVNVNGSFLNWTDSKQVLRELFPDMPDLLVPVLYQGPALTFEQLKQLRDMPSILASRRGVHQISEGVVVQPLVEMFSAREMTRLAAKFKSPLYEERASLRDLDPTELPVYANANDLINDFITAERIQHVLMKAHLSGTEVTPKNTRLFAQLLLEDIQKESEGEWPEQPKQGVLLSWVMRIGGTLLAEGIKNFHGG